jgi:hypothetical protein
MVASGLLVLGDATLVAEDGVAAEAEFRQAPKIREAIYAPTDPERLLAQIRMAEALLAQKRGKDALSLADEFPDLCTGDAFCAPRLEAGGNEAVRHWRLPPLDAPQGQAT